MCVLSGGIYDKTHTHTHTYLSDLGVGATAVSRGGMHPSSTFSQLQWKVGISSTGALLPEGALFVLDAPTAFKPGVGLQTHTTAVPQRSALVQVGWLRGRKSWTETESIRL